MEKRWFAVHTLTGQEYKVKSSIEKMTESREMLHLLDRVLVPTEEENRTARGKKRVVKKKLFPGYVLVHMALNDETRHLVRRTAGVTNFVGSSAKPVPLADSEVKHLLSQLVGEDTAKAKVLWSVGEGVRVMGGPFTEFTGKITEVSGDREKVKVNISIFGRETPVELDFTQIEKL
ncbi:MAG TPA: transcription termination/antitermination protein NusG [Armatimonadota bacterium]|nr:transcription termination/antitermination protein NusG [Armatimonadota bacterium]